MTPELTRDAALNDRKRHNTICHHLATNNKPHPEERTESSSIPQINMA